MTGTINSEARLSTVEAICMIVGNSIGTGIIAVPYLATKNSMLDVMDGCYCLYSQCNIAFNNS